MTDPIQLSGLSPRFNLPFLFAGQVQKEFFVNEAFSLTDLLLHPAIEGEASDPPDDPTDGQAWLVASDSTGSWADKEDTIAGWQAGTWLFVDPTDGLRVWDRSGGQYLIYAGSWQRPEEPLEVTGGTSIDAELRTAFVSLIEALRKSGIFSG